MRGMSEAEVAARLRPRSGNVTVAPTCVPPDVDASLQRAQDTMWAFHLIEQAFEDELWDRALGQGRN